MASFPLTIKIIPHGSNDYEQFLALRNALLRVPLGLRFTPEELARDKDDTHVAALENDRVIGGLIVTFHDDGHAQLRQMVVAENYQGTGLGLKLIRAAEALIREQGRSHVELHARVNAQGFYEKAGYTAFGTGFSQVSIPHIAMRKQLS